MNLLCLAIFLLVSAVTALAPSVVETTAQKTNYINPHRIIEIHKPIKPVSIGTFEVQTAIMLIRVHFRQLRQILRPVYSNYSIDSNDFDGIKSAILNAVNVIENFDVRATEESAIDQTIKRVSHELACMDEIKQCGNKITCFLSEDHLDQCIQFTFEIFSAFASRLWEEAKRLTGFFKNGCDPVESQMKVFSNIKLQLNSSAQVLGVLKDIDTNKWSHISELGEVQKSIRISSHVLIMVGAFLEQCEKEYILHILGGDTWPDHGDLTALIDQKLILIEANLFRLLNPEDSEIRDVKKERRKQIATFLPVKYILESKGMLESDVKKTRILKISYVLGIL